MKHRKPLANTSILASGLGLIGLFLLSSSSAFASPDGSAQAELQHGTQHEVAGHGSEHAPLNVTEFFHQNKDPHGGTLEPGEQPMNPGLLFVLINFSLFVVGLLLIFKKFVNPAVQKRHDTIQNSLNEAAALRKQAEEELSAYQAKLANADLEIFKMVEEIKTSAKEEKVRLIDQANKQAEALQRDTKARIEAEIEQAKRTIERDVVASAVEKAVAKLSQGATTNDQENLVTAFVTSIESEGARP